MRRLLALALPVLALTTAVVLGTRPLAAQQAPTPAAKPDARQPGGNVPGNRLVVFGDNAIFWGPGKPENCTLKNRYKRGEPVGWRISAIDPETGRHIEPEAEIVVHLSYNGATRDIKARWRATAAQPEREFWVAKWIVPDDAPVGIVRYSVTAKDKTGRTGEFRPYEVDASQVTIVE